MFLAAASHFKEKRIASFKDESTLKYLYSIVPFPQFIWVCELYDKNSYSNEKPLGEIILDATSVASTKPTEAVIMINYPDTIFAKDYDGESNNLYQQILDDSSQYENDNTYLQIEHIQLGEFEMYKENLFKN